MDIWAMSLDGNVATAKQVTALAEALRARLGGMVTHIRPQVPPGAMRLENNTIVTWTEPPAIEELRAIPCAVGTFAEPWPDVMIGCRPEVAALVLGVKQASGGRAKAIQIQNPNDKTLVYRFDLGAFDLIVKQSQESITGPNVIASRLPLHDLTQACLARFRADALAAFADGPATIVLIGGSDEHVALEVPDFSALGADILDLAAPGVPVFVLTSRRTGEAQKQVLRQAIAGAANIFLDHPEMSYHRALSIGSAFVVDAGSGSMGAEVAFTGAPWALYTWHGKLACHPQMKVWREMGVTELPRFSPARPVGATDELPHIADEIIRTLGWTRRRSASH